MQIWKKSSILSNERLYNQGQREACLQTEEVSILTQVPHRWYKYFDCFIIQNSCMSGSCVSYEFLLVFIIVLCRDMLIVANKLVEKQLKMSLS